MQGLLGGGEQFVALAPALRGNRRVAADDQALARVIGAGDLGQVTRVEQPDLQGTARGGQRLDLRRAQRGDPVEPGRLQFLGDARLGDYPAIPDQHHSALPQLVDLDLQRARVGGVAGKHLDGDWAVCGVHNTPKTICRLLDLPSRL